MPENETQLGTNGTAAARVAPLEIHVAARTDVGRVRSNNEDRLLVFDLKRERELSAVKTETVALRPRGVLVVVADGMGGMSAGETASQMTVENFLTSFLERVVPAPSQSDAGTLENPREAMIEAVRETNARVFARASAEAGLKGMGTTLTAGFIEGEKLYVAQVGDSRAYLLRKGELRQLTRDQTLLASLAEKGGATPQMGKAFKNMLLQAVGAQADVNVALTESPLEDGDWLLLCSDGLHGPVTTEQIFAALSGAGTPEEKAKVLVDQANANGGPDNVSVVVCEVRQGSA